MRTIKGVKYVQASARDIDFNNKEVLCVDLYEHFEDGSKQPRNEFKLSYDKLVLGMGTKSNTFGVPGLVSEEEEMEHNQTGTNRQDKLCLA